MSKRNLGNTYVSILIMLFLALTLSELIFENISNLNRTDKILIKKDVVFYQCKSLLQENLYQAEEREYRIDMNSISYNVICMVTDSLIKVSVTAVENGRTIEELVRYRFNVDVIKDEDTEI